MTMEQDVERFVGRLAPAPVCDACISERLAPHDPGIAIATNSLVGTAGFERRREPCSLCGEEKIVIRKA